MFQVPCASDADCPDASNCGEVSRLCKSEGKKYILMFGTSFLLRFVPQKWVANNFVVGQDASTKKCPSQFFLPIVYTTVQYV